MTPPEVTFVARELDDRHRAEIRKALRRIPSQGGIGSWPTPVEHIEVTRRLAGGFSGATVVSIVLHHGNHRLLRVAKIGPATELGREWRAYAELVSPVENALCARIVAATPEVVSGTETEAWRGPAALVYDHIEQQAGTPEAGVRTLEDIVREALHGPERAVDATVRVIGEVITGVAHALYHRYSVNTHPSSLRAANRSLGPNVVLEVDASERAGSLHYGRFDPRRFETACLPDDEVLTRTLTGDDLGAGTLLALSGLRPKEFTDESLVATGDDIVVRIRAEDGSEDRVRLAETAELPTFDVCGKVVATRGADHRARLDEAGASGEFADPFAALPLVLTETARGRVHSPVHGDLNPRNILLTRTRPYLIDYARAASGRPQQTDFCWLELGLLRDVFADLGISTLLALQRALAFTAELLDCSREYGEIERIGLELVGKSAPSRTAFRTLWAIRRHAHSVYPSDTERTWSRDYLTHLLVEAHRTIKWTGPVQSAEKLRASTAAAAVATEWIHDSARFRYWERARLKKALRATADFLPFDSDAAARLYADLVTALPPAREVVATARERFVRARFHDTAEKIVLDLAAQHEDYVGLTGESGDERGDALTMVTGRDEVVLAGRAGSGKTTVARELAYLLAARIVDRAGAATIPVRMPILLRAADLTASGHGVDEEALVLGAVHLIVDDLDELAAEHRDAVMASLRDLRSKYPLVPVLVCHRDFGGEPPTDLPVVRLRELGFETMRGYLRRALARTPGVDVDHLLTTLLEDPRWQGTDPRRPGVLRLVAEHFRDGGSLDTLRLNGDLSDRAARDHAAARSLLDDPDSAKEKVLHLAWHEACLVFVTLPEVTEDTVLDLVHMVWTVDPVLSARMLRAARITLPEFVEKQGATLGSPYTGPVAWRQAAEALAALGGKSARDVLLGVTVNERLGEARYEALRSLTALHEQAITNAERRATTSALTAAVHQILVEPAPAPLRAAALAVVGRFRLRGLELLAAHCVSPDGHWEVARQAMRTLRDLGTAIPSSLVDSYHALCHTQLARVEDSLRRATEDGSLREDRAELITELADTAPVSWLRERRSGFDVPSVVAEKPVLEDLDAAERDFLDLVPTVEADRIEGLSVLLTTIFSADRARGIRLAWTAAREFAKRDLEARHHWPWRTALARCRGSLAELEALLHTESALLAVEGLSSFGFHRTCGLGPRHEFRPESRERLLSLHKDADPATWILACATGGVTEALPTIEETLPQLENSAARRTTRHGTTSPPDDAATAIGYLTRISGGTHLPEIPGTGRLIALAYLGDFEPLLTALPEDPRTFTATRNALTHWTPGPRTPSTLCDPVAVTEWLGRRIAEPGVPPRERWHLAELKRLTQYKSGVLVP